MFSKTPTGKGSKGSVSIINTHGRLQLRFGSGGKRYYITLGLPDTIPNRKLAELKASEIEKDILFERFDPTLEKYKPRSSLSTVTPITPIQKAKPKLDELIVKQLRLTQNSEHSPVVGDFGPLPQPYPQICYPLRKTCQNPCCIRISLDHCSLEHQLNHSKASSTWCKKGSSRSLCSSWFSRNEKLNLFSGKSLSDFA
jgi:hypothetical protein